MPTPGGDAAFGLQWINSATAGVLPDYFRRNGTVREPVAAADVPAETMLGDAPFTPAVKGGTWTSPDRGSASWQNPAPAAGPYQVRLTDGSVVTYAWYRFIDQPALRGPGGSDAVKARVQARVELLHLNWSATHEFLAPPSAGTLATLDAALLVAPPAGLEAGYVPVVTLQEAGR